jgi:AcrR family transcriptional regulator
MPAAVKGVREGPVGAAEQWPRGKAHRRHQIMQAAEKLFTSRRFHEITMDDIAAAAGVAKGTLYGHFQDKNELFFQTATAGFDELCELLHRTVPDSAPFTEQLLGVCRQITGFYDRRHHLLHLMQVEDWRMSLCRGMLQQRWLAKRRQLHSAVAAILARGVAARQVRRDVPAAVLASILLGMLRTRAHDLADAPPELRNHEVILDLFCRGAAERPTADARTQ